jgi:RNA polymerase sigma-70 factor (sigma-B/F/G subfamily)
LTLVFSSADVADQLRFAQAHRNDVCADVPYPPHLPTTNRPVNGSIDIADDVSASRVERTHELLCTAADADQLTRMRIYDEVVLLNIEVAESIVMRYRNRGVPVEDLVQVGCLGLVKAVRGFDPDKSDNFLGYAVPTILGEVKRFFRDNAWVIKPPRRIQELQAEISATAAELMHATGRVPTPSELAAELGVAESDVNEAMAADGCFAPRSLDRAPGEVSEVASLVETLGIDDPGFARAEAVVALTPLCRALSERDRRLIYLRFFKEWTQARIAEEFGVTQMQVSRLLSRVLAAMREALSAAVEDDADVSRATDGSSRSARRSHAA